MELDHPPPRALGARRRRARHRLGIIVAIGLVVGGCSTSDDTSADGGNELAAAQDGSDDSESTDPGAGTADAGAGGAAFDIAPGIVPVDEFDGDPIDPPPADAVDLTSITPARIIDGIADQLEASDGDGAVLDAVAPVDRATRPTGESDGRPRNGLGELLVLDTEASLACAQVEIAIGLVDDGRSGDAAEWVSTAADQAQSSGIADIDAWATPLRTAVTGATVDPAPLVGFLSVCTEGGYEL